MSNPIFKIARSGEDALTVNQKNLVFDISNDYMIILQERTDQSDGSGNLQITHNLGYIPAFYTFFKDTSTGKWYRQLQSGLGGSYADTSKIYIETDDPSQYVRTVIFANTQDNSVGSGRNNASGRLRVAKFGYDAEVDTDLRRFKFASAGGVFKIKEKKSLTVTVSADDADDTAQYAHGIGYVPQVYVFADGVQIPLFYFVGAGVAFGFRFEIDNINLIIHVINSGGALSIGTTVDFQAQILLDKIE